MPQAQGKTAPVYVVFDGQSLNLEPDAATCYPTVLMADYDIPWANVAIGAESLTDNLVTAPHRTFQKGKTAPVTVLILCDGTADLSLFGGELDTGAEVYADMGAYADAARAAGFDYVIVTTIQDFNGGAGPESERLAANLLIIEDASDKFDYVVQLAEDPRLDDSSDATYYHTDQVHPNAAGAVVMAELVAAQGLDPLLASL
jgi:hypothetical protein